MKKVLPNIARAMLAVDPSQAQAALDMAAKERDFYLALGFEYPSTTAKNVAEAIDVEAKGAGIYFRIVDTPLDTGDAPDGKSNILRVLHSGSQHGPFHHDMADCIFSLSGAAPQFTLSVVGDMCTVTMNDEVTKINHTPITG
jgi:hypothetical protein